MATAILADMGLLSEALDTVITGIESSHPRLSESAAQLTRNLALIEMGISIAQVMLGDPPKTLLRKALTLATWLWLAREFHDILNGFKAWLVKAAINAAPSGARGYDLVLEPSKILDAATQATEPLLVKAVRFDINFGKQILLGLAFLAIFAAFLFLAMHVAMASIEFYLYLNFATLLAPFAVFSHTRFIADKGINSVLAAALKLAVITFILAIIEPILSSIQFHENFGDKDAIRWGEIWSVVAVVGFCCLIVWFVPRLAAGFLHGSPSLSGTSVVLGAASAATWVATRTADGAATLGRATMTGFELGFAWAGKLVSESGSTSASATNAAATASAASTPSPPTWVNVGDSTAAGSPKPPPSPADGHGPKATPPHNDGGDVS